MGILFRKKPVTVEAMRFTAETKDRVFHWVRGNTAADFEDGQPILKIQTLEGVMTARLGDWVIRGVEGEFYPCAPGIFAKTYEPAEQVDAVREAGAMLANCAFNLAQRDHLTEAERRSLHESREAWDKAIREAFHV